MSEPTLQINHDDNPDDVVEKVNRALRQAGLVFKYEQGGDGFITYRLDKSEPSSS